MMLGMGLYFTYEDGRFGDERDGIGLCVMKI